MNNERLAEIHHEAWMRYYQAHKSAERHPYKESHLWNDILSLCNLVAAMRGVRLNDIKDCPDWYTLDNGEEKGE